MQKFPVDVNFGCWSMNSYSNVEGLSSWCIGYMVGLRKGRERFRTPVALLRSLLDKYPQEINANMCANVFWIYVQSMYLIFGLVHIPIFCLILSFLSSYTVNNNKRGVMVKAMDCEIVVREFVLQSRYYVHFRANTLGKGMNPLILPAMG